MAALNCGAATWAAEADTATPGGPALAEAAPIVRPTLEQRLHEAGRFYWKTEPAPQATIGEGESQLQQNLWLSAIGLVAAGLAIRRFAPELAAALGVRLNPRVLLPGTAADCSAQVLAEEGAVSEFATEFRIGPKAPLSLPTCGLPADSGPGQQVQQETEAEADPLQAFLASAPKQVQVLRKLLQEISHESGEVQRREMLSRLGGELGWFKGMAGLPEVLPAWQMASALEWLSKQLAEKAGRITPSTLRTIASGVDALGDLCRPGVRADLCTSPLIRSLAVDDDAVSRHVVAFALKKGIGQPDLADDSTAGLALASKHPYDVIFLDVQMPSMDGFELCSRIHDTETNRNTPVVFVTAHSTFDARAKSTLCGGHELIGKPFLTSEITVKALTLALRARLEQNETSIEQPEGNTRTAAAVARLSLPSEGGAQPGPPLGPATPEVVKAFAARAREHLAGIREVVQLASQAEEESGRPGKLVDLYRRICSLGPFPDCASLRPASQVAAGLEALLKKLLEHPKNSNSSTLQTLATAVDLLGDLCVPGLKADLASNPPVRLLVVDDDAFTRRAIAGGLQLAFGRPDSAVDGAAAVERAAEKAFDVIFMDVEMPGMDGFTACARIHETAANRQTPVVFVTGHTDAETRRACVQCGGSDFITKPFLCSELTLKALTLALRHRLQIMKETT